MFRDRLAVVRTVFAERKTWRGLAWMALRVVKLFRIGLRASGKQTEPPVPVEIVYVVADKDLETLGSSIDSLDRILGVERRRIVVIGNARSGVKPFADARGIAFVDEEELIGFGPGHYRYPEETGARSGWLYQQMLKLAWSQQAAGPCIVVDADTIFVRPVPFTIADTYVFYRSEEWHQSYADAVAFLLGIDDRTPLSFVAHMMVFDPDLVRQMLEAIETRHGVPWHEAIALTRSLHASSCFSEYQLYAVWVRQQFPSRFAQRLLYNRSATRDLLNDPERLRRAAKSLQTISLHSYVGSSQAQGAGFGENAT